MSISKHLKEHEILGVQGIDELGNINAQVNHRTDTLKALCGLTLAGDGEIAVATDAPAIVKYNGTTPSVPTVFTSTSPMYRWVAKKVNYSIFSGPTSALPLYLGSSDVIQFSGSPTGIHVEASSRAGALESNQHEIIIEPGYFPILPDSKIICEVNYKISSSQANNAGLRLTLQLIVEGTVTGQIMRDYAYHDADGSGIIEVTNTLYQDLTADFVDESGSAQTNYLVLKCLTTNTNAVSFVFDFDINLYVLPN